MDTSDPRATASSLGLEIIQIGAAEASDIVVREHYLHRRPPISYAFALLPPEIFGWPLGVVTYGSPPSRHLQLGVCPKDPDMVLELNRMWVDDSLGRNSESWFVSRTLKMLPPRIVVSYADTAHGHLGYIYRALGWNYAGWTDMERRTPRADYIPVGGGHTRDAYRLGFTHTQRRKPKIKYWTVTGNKAERRELTALCGWKKMDWRSDPPPGLPQST